MAFLDSLTIEPLTPGANTGGFDCGRDQDLTDFLCDGTAASDQAAQMSRTYLVRSGEGLVAYFSVLADSIKLDLWERPEGWDYPFAPALKLGRMAVADKYQQRGVGFWILDVVVGIARNMATTAGLRYVSIDVSKERKNLIAWYGRFGFVENKGHSKLLMKLYQLATRAELNHVSMRYDVLLKEEVALATKNG